MSSFASRSYNSHLLCRQFQETHLSQRRDQLFGQRSFFRNLMAEKEKKAEHKMTVTAEVHKPREKTLVARKQIT